MGPLARRVGVISKSRCQRIGSARQWAIEQIVGECDRTAVAILARYNIAVPVVEQAVYAVIRIDLRHDPAREIHNGGIVLVQWIRDRLRPGDVVVARRDGRRVRRGLARRPIHRVEAGRDDVVQWIGHGLRPPIGVIAIPRCLTSDGDGLRVLESRREVARRGLMRLTVRGREEATARVIGPAGELVE